MYILNIWTLVAETWLIFWVTQEKMKYRPVERVVVKIRGYVVVCVGVIHKFSLTDSNQDLIRTYVQSWLPLQNMKSGIHSDPSVHWKYPFWHFQSRNTYYGLTVALVASKTWVEWAPRIGIAWAKGWRPGDNTGAWLQEVWYGLRPSSSEGVSSFRAMSRMRW